MLGMIATVYAVVYALLGAAIVYRIYLTRPQSPVADNLPGNALLELGPQMIDPTR